MVHLIMIAIVLGLAACDFVTGWAKAFIAKNVKSDEMRKGGVRKLAEVVIMVTACGLNIGIDKLAKYSDSAGLFSDIVGAFSAFGVCAYITIMEVISILENYVEMNPGAKWARVISKRLGGLHDGEWW